MERCASHWFIGLIAILFATGSEKAHDGFRYLIFISPWLPLLVTPLGFVAITVTQRFFPVAQGTGIPQTLAALQIKDPAIRYKLLSLRVAVGKVFLTLFGLLCGASVGREGPTVQIPSFHLAHGQYFGEIFTARGRARSNLSPAAQREWWRLLTRHSRGRSLPLKKWGVP